MKKWSVYPSIAWLLSGILLLGSISAPIRPEAAAAYAAEDDFASYHQLTAEDYWPGEVIVKLKDRPAAVGAFNASSFAQSTEVLGMELEQVDTLHDGAIVYRTDEEVLTTVAALAQNPEVEYVQPRYIYHLFSELEPNDPYWADLQWGLHLDNWGLDVLDAWTYTQGSDEVIVGVIDSGVDYYHEDLHVDSDRVLVLPGSNFVVTPDKDENTPMDGMNNGHGTHVAGTIAAAANNGLGVAGVAPNIRIIPVKAGPDDAQTLYYVEQGVEFAINHGAKIINLSLGGNGCSNPLLYGLIQSNPDVLFVAAAGNNGIDLAEYPVFPAIFSADSTCFGTPYPALPNILTVGSINQSGNLSSFSNFSETYVNLAAPGSAIHNLFPRDESGISRYKTLHGTSMAAPHVSGAAALIYSLAPDLTPAEVIGILEQTVTPSEDLSEKVKTGGTLNAGAAVAYTANRVEAVTADQSGEVAAGTAITLSTAMSGADIYYTLDGSEPSFADGVAVSGERYEGPIVIDAPVTIKARAYKDGLLRSETAEFAYSILIDDEGGGEDSGDGSSGGGTGGNGYGGGSYSGSQASDAAPVPPAVEMTDEPGILIVRPELDTSSNAARASLDEEIWNAAIETAETDHNGLKTVTLNVESVQNAAAYELTVPLPALASTSDETRLTIVTDIAVVTLRGNMLARNAADPSTTVTLSISRADASQIASEQTQSLIEQRPTIRIELKIGDEAYSWNNPLSPAIVSIPYTPGPEEQAAFELLSILYIDPAGKASTIPSGRYDLDTGTVIFQTSHFSDFAVAFVHKSFDDLEAVPWAQHPIEVLAAKGVVQGDSLQSFSPSKNVTRADFVLMLVRMLGVSAEGDDSQTGFDDVAPNAYYADAIHIAQKLGVATGFGDGRFHPDAFISRQDMAVLTDRALRLSGLEWGSAGTIARPRAFSDRGAIAEYALDSLELMVKNNLIVGAYGELRPQHNSSRAEAAVLLYRVYNLVFGVQR